MSDKAETVRTLYLEHITRLTNKVPLKVMLGDGTVTDQESFDPAQVRKFFDDILQNIPDWTNQGVSATAEKDLRRSFITFEIKEGNYYKPGKNEEFACRGYEIVQRLVQRGKLLELAGCGREYDRAKAEPLVQRMCLHCDFQPDGCDFMIDRKAPPCGGFILLAQLIASGAITIEDIS